VRSSQRPRGQQRGGAGQGDSEQGSPRRRGDGEAEEGLWGGGVLRRGGGVLQWPTMLIRGMYHETNEGGEAGLVREDEAGRSLELTGRWRNGGGVFGSGGAGRALVAGAGLEDGEAKVGSSHGGGKQRKECSGGGRHFLKGSSGVEQWGGGSGAFPCGGEGGGPARPAGSAWATATQSRLVRACFR
jgi:hypothetical protein